MKLLKSIFFTVVLIASASADVAWASHHASHFSSSRQNAYHHPGWGHGHGYSWGIGFYGAGWPWFYPGYYGYAIPVLPDSLYPEAGAPVNYVELNSAPPTGDAPTNVWYYCESAQGYYPYVKSCVGGWKQIPAEPAK